MPPPNEPANEVTMLPPRSRSIRSSLPEAGRDLALIRLVSVSHGKVEDVMWLAHNHDFMLNHQYHELLAIHERDWDCIRAGGFVFGSLAEITGGDDESLLVRTETAPDLLDVRCLDVALVPLLDLHGHLGADNLADDQHAAHVDSAVLARRCHFEFLKADLGQKLGDEVLELGGSHRYEAFENFGANLPVVLLDVEGQPLAHPCAETDKPSLVLDEARLLSPCLVASDLGEDLRIHRRLGRLRLGVEQAEFKGL